MTTHELVSILIRTDLALAGGTLAATALRLPVRRWLGARAAYALWLLPPATMGTVLAPPRIVFTTPSPMNSAPDALLAAAQASAPGPLDPALAIAPPALAGSLDPQLSLLAIWALGVVVAAAWFARGQIRFLRQARLGVAGPAVVGVIRPRVVTPADFDERFSPAEREAILSHELAHIAARHPLANAVAALVQALHWFNPLVHLGAHLMRIDQELACDAAVIARRPAMRRLYAETLLKSQISTAPLPLGCYWPPRSEHPLTQRMEMLQQARAERRWLGAAAVAVLTAAAGMSAWAAQPAQLVMKAAAEPSAPTAAPVVTGPARQVAAANQTPEGARLTDTVSPREVAAGMARRAMENVQAAQEDYRRQAPMPADAFDRDPTAPVHLSGLVLAYDETAPRARVHLADIQTGKAWVVEVGGADTLRRAGVNDMVGQTVQVDAHQTRDRACTPECKAVLRQMTFRDGRRLFLGAATQPAAAKDEKAVALARGDWRGAASLGASAPEIVAALQAKGKARGVKPNEAVVVIPPDGGEPQVTALKPLPPLDGAPATPLNGTGFGFSARPGSIILYPPGTKTFSDGGARFAPAANPASGRSVAEARLTAAETAYANVQDQYAAGLIPLGDLDNAALKVLEADRALTELTGRPRWLAQPRQPGARTPIIRRVSDSGGPRPPPGWRAFAAVYDGNAPVLLKGKVTGIEWTSPRVLLHLSDAATGKTWAVEGASPEALAASGFTREQFAKGTEIAVRGYQAKDKACTPECLANGRDVTFADGTKRYIGSTPTR